MSPIKTRVRNRAAGALVALIGLALFFRFLLIGRHFDGLYGQDAYEYLRFANELSQWLAGSGSLGNFFWPVGYPATMVLADVLPWIPDLAMGGQLTSMVAGASLPVAVGVAVYRLVANLLSAVYAATIAATAGLLWISSVTVMSDALAITLLAWSVTCLSTPPDSSPKSRLTRSLGVLLASGTVLVRWSYLPVAFALLAWALLQDKSKTEQSEDTKSSATSNAWLVVFFLCPIAISLGLLSQGLGTGLLDNASGWRLGHLSSTGLPGALQELPIPNFVFYFLAPLHPSLLGLAALLVCVGWSRRRALPLGAQQSMTWLLAGYVLAAVLASGYALRNPRFVLATLPLLAVTVGLGLAPALSLIQDPRLRRAVIAILWLVPMMNLWFAEERVSELLETKQASLATIGAANEAVIASDPENPTVWTFGATGALRHYTNLTVRDLYLEEPNNQRVTTLLLPETPKQLALRWPGTELEKRLQRLKIGKMYREIPLPQGKSNWRLYQHR